MTAQKSEGPAATGQRSNETNQHTGSLLAAEKSSNSNSKDFTTLQARFALLGRELTRCHRAHDGRISYAVTRWGESRYFTHLHDVDAHLVQIGRRP